MTPVRLEPAAPRSRVKHSTTEPLRNKKSRKNNDADLLQRVIIDEKRTEKNDADMLLRVR